MCPHVENPDLVFQKTDYSLSSTHPRPAECNRRRTIQAGPDHPNRMVPSCRGLPSNMFPVTNRSTWGWRNKLPQFVSPVPDPQAWAVEAISLSWEDLNPYAFPPVVIFDKGVEKLQDFPCNRIILIVPGWPNIPWFWDLVTMSSQIPLCLPSLPNLLTQPFNQTLHWNLSNLNLHAWLLEPLLSRSRTSLRQWQHKSRLLKEDQLGQSIRQNGPIFTKRCLNNQVDFRAPPLKTITDFLLDLMAIDQPLLTSWEIPPLMSAKMRISLVSWIAATETEPRVGWAFPLGTFPWYCTS